MLWAKKLNEWQGSSPNDVTYIDNLLRRESERAKTSTGNYDNLQRSDEYRGDA